MGGATVLEQNSILKMATLSKTDRKLLFWFILLLALPIVPWFV
jgi:hypothetical protein